MKTLLRKLLARKSSPKRRPEPRRVLPQVEGLEERQVMSVTFHGGSVLSNVEVASVFYGSGWDNDPSGVASYVENRLKGAIPDLVNSPYMDMLTNAGYGVGRGSAYWDNVWDNLDTTQPLDDSTLQGTLQGWIDGQTVPDADQNRLYVIFVQPNVAVTWNDQASNDPDLGFSGYHSSFAGHDSSGNPVNIRYAVVPYPGGAVGNLSTPSMSISNQLTLTASGEIANAVTDPDGSAWYDDSSGAPVDAADQVGGQTVYVDGYAVQRVADQNDQPMTPADATAARPVTFVVQNRWFPERVRTAWGTYVFTYWQTNELYESVNGALQPVTYADGSPVLSIQSISDQGIDNDGNAMIDVVLKDGEAYEYHDQTGLVFLDNGVKDAKAGQGVSYLLYNNGNVSEYTDANQSFAGIDVGVSAIDAGTDRYGVNMEAEIWNGQAWTHSDSTGWQQIPFSAYNVVQISAGRQGVVGFVDDHNYSWDWSQNSNQVTWLSAGMAKITIGYDQNGGAVIDELFSNGILWDWRAANGWQQIDAAVVNVSKARAGVVDDVESVGNALQFDPWLNNIHLGTDIQQVA